MFKYISSKAFYNLLLFLLVGLLIFSCRKTDVKVNKTDNDVSFILLNNQGGNANYIVGFTDKRNSVVYQKLSLTYSGNNSSWNEGLFLSRDDDYFFSVDPISNFPVPFTMQMNVNGKLYKEIVVSNPVTNFTYTISGKLETIKE